MNSKQSTLIKTAEEIIKERYPFYNPDITFKDVELNGEQVQELMEKYAEQFKAQEQKPVDATVEMLNDIISWEKDLSEYHSLEGILRERYKITKR